MHCCIRVYNNGDRVVEWRETGQVEQWLEHNSVFRFGQALFVDAELKRTGYLSQERCETLAEQFKQELEDGKLRVPTQARYRMR